MSQLGYFVGTWSCIGNQPFTPFGDEHEIQALMVNALNLNGFWLQLGVTEIRTGDNDEPGAWTYQIGYDSVGKQFVASWADNYGGWGTQTSQGWDKDLRFVLTGTYRIHGDVLSARDTFEQANSTTLVHVSEMMGVGGKDWITIESETCHKNFVG